MSQPLQFRTTISEEMVKEILCRFINTEYNLQTVPAQYKSDGYGSGSFEIVLTHAPNHTCSSSAS